MVKNGLKKSQKWPIYRISAQEWKTTTKKLWNLNKWEGFFSDCHSNQVASIEFISVPGKWVKQQFEKTQINLKIDIWASKLLEMMGNPQGLGGILQIVLYHQVESNPWFGLSDSCVLTTQWVEKEGSSLHLSRNRGFWNDQPQVMLILHLGAQEPSPMNYVFIRHPSS